MLFAGCRVKPIPASASDTPSSSIEGYYDSTQSLSGGIDLSSQNLADIHIETIDESTTRLTLSFMTGSTSNISGQEISSGVPKYSTSFIAGLNRMVIALEGINYWTYRLYEDELADSYILGLVHQRPVDSNLTQLYISIADNYAYKIEELNNKLIVTYKHIPVKATSSYYVMLNAYAEYENTKFSKNIFYPCISDDGDNAVLLSKGFATEDEAAIFLEQHLDIIEQFAPKKTPLIIYLSNNELPKYSFDDELLALSKAPIAIKGETPISYPAMIIDGRFLNWDNDYRNYSFVKPYTIRGAQKSDYYRYEQIMQFKDNSSKNILEYQFTSILNTQYSFNNEYIAFIDQNAQTRMLEIVHLKSGKLYIPADDGFGMDTSSFVWSDKENKLYAISGDYSNKQLLCYDLSDPNDIDIYAIVEEKFNESRLDMAGDKLYYLKRNEQTINTMILEIDVSTNEITDLHEGKSFVLSPNGRSLVINTISDDKTTTIIYNILTGEITQIQNSQSVMDFVWSKNSSKVFYTVNRNVEWDNIYPMALYYYDVNKMEVNYIADIATGALYQSSENDSVLFMCIHQLQDRSLPITYIVGLD